VSTPRRYESHITRDFWACYRRLSSDVKDRARETYKRWQANSNAPGLDFKTMGHDSSVCEIRVGDHYRAAGIIEGNAVYWFWIGTKNEFRKKF
jgi:hypothetical protein